MRYKGVSLSTSNPYTSPMPISLAQPNHQTALQTKQCPPLIQQQDSRCVIISKGIRAAAMLQHANMTMYVLNHSVWGITHNGKIHPLYTKPPSLNSHSPAEIFPKPLVEPNAGDSSTTSPTGRGIAKHLLRAAECYYLQSISRALV